MNFNINNTQELKELLEALKSDLNLNMNIEINIDESDEEPGIYKSVFDFDSNVSSW